MDFGDSLVHTEGDAQRLWLSGCLRSVEVGGRAPSNLRAYSWHSCYSPVIRQGGEVKGFE